MAVSRISTYDTEKVVNPSYGGYDPNENSEIPNLLSLPNEMLIKIVLFLSEARDRDCDMCHWDYEVSVKHHHYGVSLCGLIVTVVTKKNV